ncbi:DNA-binding response regulator, OmpR family, contains REC and winged-helix (wHTH) domain [Ruminococcaceae bacterium KH2T8]|nr:DNA-binding response regulator, OmpR family, contains REC and winged-helix (wHTH) domain [Ruminococcaceae bacterium KH2T8]
MGKVLVCDDEKDIVSALKIYLTSDGYDVECAYNGMEACEKVKTCDIDLVLLDIMMPGMDGVTALSRIRETSNVPVIFLTAKGEDTDKVLGLNIGADDYVTKPFNPVELLARVRSQLRRYKMLGSAVATSNENVYSKGGIEIDDNTKKVTVDGETVNLTKTEYEILLCFIKNKGKVMSPKQLYKEVWHDDPYGTENTVAVHIRHLREKIEIDPANPRYIKVVWGYGYMMEE